MNTHEMRVDQGTLQIGSEFYQLNQISRVSTYHVIPNRSVGRYIFWLCVGCALYMVAASGMPVILTYISLVIVAWNGWRIVQKLIKRDSWQLQIDSSGIVRGVLESPHQNEIAKARDFVIQALRQPPVAPISLQLSGDVVIGDKITQSGPGSIGKVVH